MNGHVVRWPSLGSRLLMKEDQACFLEFMIVLFLDASAFFRAALNDGDRGDRRHSFSACLAVKTAAWQDTFHQGRRGSLGGLRGWVDKRKVELLEASMDFMKSLYSKSGTWNSRKNEAIRRLSRILFHRGYFDLSKIHDGVLFACQTGFMLSVVMMGR